MSFYMVRYGTKMDTQEIFLQDFEYIYKGYVENLIDEINTKNRNHFEDEINYYADKKEIFFTDEEKAELYEVIKQKTYLELAN